MSRRPGSAGARGVGTAHLLRRQVLTDSSAVATVVVLVLVSSALVASVPRLLDTLQSQGARTAVAQTGSLLRDLSTVAFAAPSIDAGADAGVDTVAGDPLAPTREMLDEIAAALPPLVRDRVGTAMFAVDVQDLTVAGRTPEIDAPADNSFLDLTVQSGFDDQVRYVEGRPPSSITVERRPDAPQVDAARILPGSLTHQGTLEVAVSARTAADLGLAVGSRVTVAEAVLTLEVVGVFEALDAASAYWAFDTRLLTPGRGYSSSLGFYYTGAAIFAGAAYPGLEQVMGGVRSPVTLLRLPVTARGLDASDVPGLLAAVRDVEGTTFSAPPRVFRPDDPPLFSAPLETFRLSTDLDEILTEHLEQRAVSTAVVSLVVSGLLGVSVAVLALAGRLVVERRQRSLALAVARGASSGQLRVLMALEGVVLGMPAAVAGWLVAHLVVPGDPGTWGVALPLVLGVAPGVLLPALARPGGLRAVRRDVTSVRDRRLRTTGEAFAVLAAVAAVVLLRRRGLATGAADTGVDPLLAAAPLLVALPGALLLARIYPVPVTALTRALARRRGAVSFLGAARAGRDAPAGTLPLVVLLLALSTSVFGAVVSATTARGAELAATATVGADARIGSLGLDDDALAAGRSVPGVAALAGLTTTAVDARTGSSTDVVTLVAAQAGELARVQRDVPGAPDFPPDLTADGAGRVPAVVQAGLADVGEQLVLGEGSDAVDALVVGTAPGDLPSLLTARPWVVVDRAAYLEAGGDVPLYTTVLVDTGGGPVADPARLEADLQQAMGTVSPLLTRAGAVERAQGAPLVAGTLAAFPVASAVAAGLSALAVVLTLVVTAPARSRLLSRLRTLGLSPRQAQGLAVWEVAPLAVTALVAGLLLGLAIPWLVAPAVDLRSFTGGAGPPPYTVGWEAIAVIVGGFLVLITLAVAGTVSANRRLRLGAVLRVGEEQ